MTRPATAIGLGLVAALGWGLFQLKHEVRTLELELAQLNRRILDEQEAVHVLEAEWSYLNEPRRLKALSGRHLELAPLAAAQVVTPEDLSSRLDPVMTDASNPAAAGGATPVSEREPR